MDLNYLLKWIAGVWAVTALVRLAQSGNRSARGWTLKFALILLALLAGEFFIPEYSGYLAGGLYLVLVFIPMKANQVVNERVLRQEYGSAYRLSQYTAWMHPFDDWRFQPQHIHALELAQQGDFAGAANLLQMRAGTDTPISRVAHVQLFRLSGRWEDLLFWLTSTYGSEERILRLPELVHWYLRALGETGDLNGLILAFEKFAGLKQQTNLFIMNLCFLDIFAFSGSRKGLEALFTGPLQALPPGPKRFWLATADLVSGNETAGRAVLEADRQTAAPSERVAIDRRLQRSLPNASETLTPKTRAIVQQLEQSVAERNIQQAAVQPTGAPVVTYALIAANVLAFAIETMFGGSTNMDALDRLGTLIPGAVLAGQWWRVLTSIFLHYGMLHLGMNMLGLYYLGPFVEQSLRRAKFIVIYFASGLGSMLVIVALTVSGLIDNGSTLGASGCIMGLVGATGAVLFQLWRRQRSRVALQRLYRVILIVALQILFDISTPEVSFTGHFAGTIIGFLVALLLENHGDTESRRV